MELPVMKQDRTQPKAGPGVGSSSPVPLPMLEAGSKEENQHHSKGSGQRRKHSKERSLIAKPQTP